MGNNDRLDTERLDAAMRAAGIRRDRHLAELIGASPSQITRWRAGDTTPQGGTLVALAVALDVAPEWLLGRDRDELAAILARRTPAARARVEGYARGLLDEQLSGATAIPSLGSDAIGDATAADLLSRRARAPKKHR